MISKADFQSKRVLIFPLNWGLGHASRLIPIIKECLNSGAEVVIGGSPKHLAYLQEEVGCLETISMPYLTIRLSRYRSQFGLIALQLPAIAFYILREHLVLNRIISLKKIDLVISDNCYGLWNRSIPCIFITHQLFIQVPGRIRFLSGMINRINRWFIEKYDVCWIPDDEDNGGLAGKLSHCVIKGSNTTFIGILSRFQNVRFGSSQPESGGRKKLLILISGPERQRTVFEQTLCKQLQNLPSDISVEIVRGLPGHKEEMNDGWHNHVETIQLGRMILEADFIICRAGYSTIMDLVALHRTALLVPTPGQSEQEYLAEYLSSKGYFLTMKQKEFNLLRAIRNLEKNSILRPYDYVSDVELLRSNLSKWLNLPTG